MFLMGGYCKTEVIQAVRNVTKKRQTVFNQEFQRVYLSLYK